LQRGISLLQIRHFAKVCFLKGTTNREYAVRAIERLTLQKQLTVVWIYGKIFWVEFTFWRDNSEGARPCELQCTVDGDFQGRILSLARNQIHSFGD
jgi:hypothetical protein